MLKEKGWATNPLSQRHDRPPNREVMSSEHLDQSIEIEPESRTSNPKRLLKSHDSRSGDLNNRLDSKQTRSVHLVVNTIDRMSRREELAWWRQMQDVDFHEIWIASCFGAISQFNKLVCRFVVALCVREVRVPGFASLLPEVESPKNAKASHGCSST